MNHRIFKLSIFLFYAQRRKIERQQNLKENLVLVSSLYHLWAGMIFSPQIPRSNNFFICDINFTQ